MSTNDADPHKGHDNAAPLATPDDYAHGWHDLGVDAEGYAHKINLATVTVHRLDWDGSIERERQLGDRGEIADWVAFVREQIGWETLHYSDDAAEATAEAVREMFGVPKR